MQSAQNPEEIEVESSLTESPSRLTESRVTDAAVTHFLESVKILSQPESVPDHLTKDWLIYRVSTVPSCRSETWSRWQN